jgi:hypothetical protein
LSVLIEALCLVVPNRVLDISYPGGSTQFIDHASARPDVRYALTDGRVCAVSMYDSPAGIALVDELSEYGIVGTDDSRAFEFVFVDMETGPATRCDWLDTQRHSHGFMLAWQADAESGNAVVPGDWDPSVTWNLERRDIRDNPEQHLLLGQEDDLETVLDFETGRIARGFGARSPVVAVGRDQPTAPETWAPTPALNPVLAVVHRVLQGAGIPYHADTAMDAIIIPFVCEVAVEIEETTVTQEISQRVVVKAGLSASSITCMTVLPICVPVHKRNAATSIVDKVNEACGKFMMVQDDATGTIAIMTHFSSDQEALTERQAERAIANASPLGGNCYEALSPWLDGEESKLLTTWRLLGYELPTE